MYENNQQSHDQADGSQSKAQTTGTGVKDANTGVILTIQALVRVIDTEGMVAQHPVLAPVKDMLNKTIEHCLTPNVSSSACPPPLPNREAYNIALKKQKEKA